MCIVHWNYHTNQFNRIINTFIMKDSSLWRFLIPSVILPTFSLLKFFHLYFHHFLRWFGNWMVFSVGMFSPGVLFILSLFLPLSLVLSLNKSFAQSDFVSGKFQFGTYVWCCAVCCVVWIQLRVNSSTEIRCRTRTNTHNITQSTDTHTQTQEKRTRERAKEREKE